MDIIQETGR